jgi:drug/metabolite transporter (DMT)-like permease
VNEKTRGTVQGILALLFWGSTIAFSRSLTEKLGTLTSASYIFLLAGTLSCAYLVVSRRFQMVIRVSRAYLFGCGTLFVVYMASLYLAIGTAVNRLQVLEVGLVNYLWPSLTLVMAIPVLKRKARFTLIPGCLLGFGGVLFASAQFGESWETFVGNLSTNWSPYMLAFVAAVCWALYSNLTRRWAREAESGAVPLFLLASGLVLLGLRILFPERTEWTSQSILELAYMAIFSSILAYAFWDAAMRRGNATLVASVSYLTPLLSITIGSIYLGVGTGWNLWAGCLLVIVGSVTCKLSVKDAD